MAAEKNEWTLIEFDLFIHRLSLPAIFLRDFSGKIRFFGNVGASGKVNKPSRQGYEEYQVKGK